MEYGEIGGGSQSQFNEATLKMLRIHKFQETAGICNFNPKEINQMTGEYNYKLILTCNDNLLKECWGKMSDKERVEVMKLRDDLYAFLEKHPVHKEIYLPNQNKKQVKEYPDHWKIFQGALFKYELRIRELLSRVKYDAPDQDEGGLFD